MNQRTDENADMPLNEEQAKLALQHQLQSIPHVQILNPIIASRSTSTGRVLVRVTIANLRRDFAEWVRDVMLPGGNIRDGERDGLMLRMISGEFRTNVDCTITTQESIVQTIFQTLKPSSRRASISDEVLTIEDKVVINLGADKMDNCATLEVKEGNSDPKHYPIMEGKISNFGEGKINNFDPYDLASMEAMFIEPNPGFAG